MKKFKKYIFILVLVAIVVLLSKSTYTLAKYVYNSAWDYYLKSKEFYFSSDYLATTVVKNVDNLWNGESVYFNIKNNYNQTIITDYDISYKAVCSVQGDASSYVQCHLNGSDSNTSEGVLSAYQTCINNKNNGINVSSYDKTSCELGGYEWNNQIATKDLYFDIVLIDDNYEISDLTVNVTVTSTSPYKKILTGDFFLRKASINENDITMEYKNYSNYGRLIVTNTYSVSKCVKIMWNANNLLIDLEDEISYYGTDNDGYINEIAFNIGAKNSIGYIFYKRDFSETYDITEFSIIDSNNCN